MPTMSKLRIQARQSTPMAARLRPQEKATGPTKLAAPMKMGKDTSTRPAASVTYLSRRRPRLKIPRPARAMKAPR